jgi:hypothetical protein
VTETAKSDRLARLKAALSLVVSIAFGLAILASLVNEYGQCATAAGTGTQAAGLPLDFLACEASRSRVRPGTSARSELLRARSSFLQGRGS